MNKSTQTNQANDRPSGTTSDAQSEQAQQTSDKRAQLIKVSQVIWFLTAILEAFIGIRVLLKLMAANPEAGFAQFVYNLTAVFLAPFSGLMPKPSAGGAVLELASVFAMIIYALLAWGVVRAIWLIFSEP
jgi:uncharacterized protein YggT (Ycf19 family)